MSTSNPTRDPVEKLAEEFAERFRRGERPSLTEYTTQYPDLADQIRDLFPALVAMEQFGSVADPAQEISDSGVLVGAQIPRQLGEFRILREVGRGGMGVVFEAVQESLGRHVALKVLVFHGIVKPTYLERFSREARAAAQLHHTNIVPVFGIGEHQGIHYYAMQFIQGQGLDVVLREVKRLRPRASGASSGSQPAENSERFRELTVSIAHNLVTGHTERSIEENGGPRLDWIAPADSATTDSGKQLATSPTPPDDDSGLARQPEAQYFRSVARLGVQVAEALDYAHKQGILHRDIKPSNLLLDTRGLVWITDFGLVKAEGSDELTSPGDIVGTVRFMAPERFQGKTDPRNDIYGLGITLYEMLTLRPAFEDANRARLIERVAHEDPPRPRKLDPHIPRDLETIVLKAIAKEPARRYATAEAMAEDLRRFLADRPIRARRTSSFEKAWRWCRRNPVEAILTSSVAALLVALVIGLSVAVLLRKERNEALANWERAETAEQMWHEEHNRAVATGHLAAARASRWSGKVGQRFDSLKKLAAAAKHHPSLELRNEAIACLALTDLRLAKSWDGFPTGTHCLAFDSEFKRYVRSDSHGNLSLRTVEDDREIMSLPGPGPHAYYLKFSPDGKFLAAIYHNLHPTSLYIWDLRRRKEILCLGLSGGMDFSPDSRRIVVGDHGSVRFYDLASGKEEKRLAIGQGDYDFAFDPTGLRLAIASSQPRTVQIYDLVAAKVVMTLPNQQTPIWSSDGKQLATISDVHIFVWDALTGRQQAVLQGHQSRVIKAALARRGDLLASTGWDGTLRLWDPLTGRQLLRLEGADFSCQFSPNDLLAYTRTGSKIELWELAKGSAVCREFRGPNYQSLTAWTDFSPDGRLLASASGDGARLWDLDADREAAFIPIGETRSVFFPPTHDALITSGDRGVYKWPIRTVSGSTDFQIGPPQAVGEPGETWDACLDLNGHKLAVVQRNKGRAMVVDLDEKAGQVHLGNHANIARIAISPNNRWVATATYWGFESTTKIWDAQTGKLVRDLPRRELQGDATVAFSPDGRWLVTGNGRGYRFWHVGSWEPGGLIAKEHGSFGAMAFSRDGKMMAILKSPQRVQLIDLSTDAELADFEAPDSLHIQHLCFSPDGSRLSAGCIHQVIQIWDLRAIRGELAAMGLDWDLPPYGAPMADEDRMPLRIKVDMGTPPTADLSPLAQVGLNSFLLTMSPFNYQAYMERGIAHTRLREWKKAIEDFSMALTLLPPDAKTRVRALVQRSYNYSQINDYSRTLADLQQALKLDPDDLQACNNLAWFYVTGPEKLRRPDLALPLAKKAVDKAANQWEFLNTLGVAFYRAGEYEQAIATLGRSLREGNNQAAAFDLFFLAMCHARLGDAVKAQDHYDRAVKWIQEHPDQVTPEWAEELKDFRAEADAVLAKSGRRSKSR